jgi:hypothetical protein
VERPSAARPLDAATATRAQLLNLALDVHLEWGPERARSERERLLERARHLDRAQAHELLAEATHAASLSFDIVYDGWGDGSHRRALAARAAAAVRQAHGWVDDDNLSRLLNQSCYYAWRG